MADMIDALNKDPQFARYGRLAQEYCNVSLPLQVLKSAAGHYIGTASNEGPTSRESVEYWTDRDAAEKALANNAWTQRNEP